MPNTENELIHIEGTVETVLFCNEQNGYIVLDLDTGGDYVTVVGELGTIEEGEELRLTGKYVTHPKFGAQFRAEACERKLPATETAILKYLSSGVIKGIGPTLAKRMVEEFGDKTLEVIENTPEDLIKVKGMSAKKTDEISQEFRRIFGIRALMIFLAGYGVSPSVAVSAWKRWGQFAVEQIKANPYILCSQGIELEFSKAEEMAAKLEIPKDSPGRIRAGICYILTHNAFNGHTCLPEDRLKETAVKLLDVGEEVFDDNLSAACDDDELCVYDKDGRNFVFLQDFFRAEQYISTRLSVMNDCFKDTGTDYSKLIDIEEKTKIITYADKQREAISLALSKGFLILTGGPGTGKTTTLKAIISLYEQRGMKVMITAPTGRAAKRIADLTGYPAKTIHRLLEVMYDKSGQLKFKHNEQDPVSCDVMIIDEMSMVDTLLFESLLRALKLSCRLIMVGDSDQLPSVGAGNILKDMIDSGRLTVVALNEIFRQAQQSCIITNAHKIVNGEEPDLSRKDSDFFFMQRLDAEGAAVTVTELCSRRLPDAYGYSPLDDIQVLCPSRKGILGSVEMNKMLQRVLNPPKKELSEVKGILFTFRDGDKVMQTKNNYDIVWKKDGENGTGIFNGDIGIIVKVKRGEGTVVIDFEGRIAEYSLEMLEQLELAYAITVHKSQGSEFTAVIIPLLGGFDKLYYRNLLYTAVTRAKKMLIIVGSKSIVEKMVHNDRRTLRYTCLRHMIESELG
ncbi:SF1B family DNA helicase RecD2 [Huintestinicola butyrica]|uniref:SF1B family DNA helicase RecD2 n=1 Tax=Huintestinicola butyrica TaxID=2981728 RepID=UPI003F8015ED